MFNDYFYKWYPEIYRDNTLHLTAEQDGIYRRLIDHYMLSRQPLPDNDAALARIAGVDISTMVATMVQLRLFFGSTEGKLTHDFCNRMLDEQDSYSKKQSEKGLRSAKKRKLKAIEKQRELNSGSTVVQPSFNQASTKEKDKEKEEEYKEKKVVGTRFALQDPPMEWIQFCQTQRPDLDAGMTFDSFRDYWVGVAGAKGVKLDWIATWRNWVRNQKQTNKQGGNHARINQIGEALQRGLDRIERSTKEAGQSFS